MSKERGVSIAEAMTIFEERTGVAPSREDFIRWMELKLIRLEGNGSRPPQRIDSNDEQKFMDIMEKLKPSADKVREDLRAKGWPEELL